MLLLDIIVQGIKDSSMQSESKGEYINALYDIRPNTDPSLDVRLGREYDETKLTPAEALEVAFKWHNTQQGAEYWIKLQTLL